MRLPQPFLLSALILSFLAVTLGAREITLERAPFSIAASFPAVALPVDPECLVLDAKSWNDFRIKEILPHGTRVRKGDVLVTFDAEEIDKQLADLRRTAESSKQAVDQSAAELDSLRKSLPLQLDAARRNRRIAREDLAYFQSTGRKAMEERAAEELKHAEELVASTREELKQLEKMYQADDITDETEEFILKRQRSAVASAELALRLTRQDTEHTQNTEVARKHETLEAADKQAAITLDLADANLPRTLRAKEIEYDTAKTNAERAAVKLADLEADRSLFSIKAPADGWFYHGAIENGRWITGDVVKSLVRDGRVPPRRPFASVVISSAPLGLVAFVEEAVARGLAPKQAGAAVPQGREDMPSAVSIIHISETPGTDGKWRIDLAAGFPAGLAVAPGMTWEASFVSYHNGQAITVPPAALSCGPDGMSWTVEVKLADGKTEPRAVRRGRANKDLVEILSGVEPGQVIVIPDKARP